MSAFKIQTTKNYKLFRLHSDENRPLEPAKRHSLKESMKKYGFLKCYPIICFRDQDGNLIVKDGQHRLAIAEELGLAVCWVLAETDFDVAFINSTTKGWSKKDYVMKYAANGIAAYDEILALHERHGIAITFCAMLLSGQTTFHNVSKAFHGGTFKVKDKRFAEAVAGVYAACANLSTHVKDAHFLSALMACHRVKDFDATRLLRGLEHCREKLVKYGNRDGYLDMIEKIYNFKRSNMVGLKVAALMAMRERNPANKKKPKDSA